MDDSGRHENGRHKPPQGQWFMHHQPSMKQIMAVMAERDAAIQERNLAISEKKAALVERDMAIMQRDSAISERNNAIIERDKAIAINKGNMPPCPPGPTKRANEAKPAKPTKKGASKSSKKVKLENEGLNKTVFGKSRERKNGLPGPDMGPGLNETNMAGAVCSCTGVLRPCYKWGNGGWQSSCCTMNLSMYPLPAVPNKRHARVGGRKMSGSAFSKLQNRLSSEGHDLSKPVDLKDHWAKHGTNRYITIK